MKEAVTESCTEKRRNDTVQVIILKRKIEQLLNGKFEYSAPPLVILPEEVTVKVEPGEVMRGTLWIEARTGKRSGAFFIRLIRG